MLRRDFVPLRLPVIRTSISHTTIPLYPQHLVNIATCLAGVARATESFRHESVKVNAKRRGLL